MKTYTLKKEELLRGQSTFDLLFKNGSSFFMFPFKVIFLIQARQEKHLAPVQFAIAVPKKRLKRANKRNYIKRRVKEIYRLNKQDVFANVLQQEQMVLQFVLVFSGNTIFTTQALEPKLKNCLIRLSEEYAKCVAEHP